MNTNTNIKKKYFPKFCKEVWSRIEKGRDKYKLQSTDEKEVTDIADELVKNFNLGDVVKYLGEYLNTQNEKDLFDIAGMVFIRWLRDKK